ncbi:glycosyltransferase family 8 protein [Paenibacillus sp. GP183]|uniref:glycosyltransferase family 8 protein n=1 Tax=Paenibacillus sp. GP183 TaxID=1882751 RepID=UPI00089827FB|nr:glycosyltransferase family 8 protein [Paenibacillus sp. GP183]SEC69881.1 Lipopolysaccharide biosynthesis protein, LPS:glycosyltransferase [Paenibacillus sp. GP183]
MERLHIVTVTNDRYAKHLAVMLNSLLENKTSKNPIDIYVIDGNISDQNKANLRNSVKKFDVQLKYLSINESMFNEFKLSYHISKETYYRILIPNLLSRDIQKALYLDCDMIIKDDITKLWNTAIENNFLAAVKIPGSSRPRELGLPENSEYFNAGVLLINMKKWREHRIVHRVLRFARNNPSKLKFMDQDALNAILHDKWIKLEPTWNYQVHRYRGLRNPAIIHYTTNQKPWNSNPPFKDDYMKYLRRTSWD